MADKNSSVDWLGQIKTRPDYRFQSPILRVFSIEKDDELSYLARDRES